MDAYAETLPPSHLGAMMNWKNEIPAETLNDMISNARTRIYYYEEHYNFTQSEAEKERMTFAIDTALQTIKFYETILGSR